MMFGATGKCYIWEKTGWHTVNICRHKEHSLWWKKMKSTKSSCIKLPNDPLCKKREKWVAKFALLPHSEMVLVWTWGLRSLFSLSLTCRLSVYENLILLCFCHVLIYLAVKIDRKEGLGETERLNWWQAKEKTESRMHTDSQLWWPLSDSSSLSKQLTIYLSLYNTKHLGGSRSIIDSKIWIPLCCSECKL